MILVVRRVVLVFLLKRRSYNLNLLSPSADVLCCGLTQTDQVITWNCEKLSANLSHCETFNAYSIFSHGRYCE